MRLSGQKIFACLAFVIVFFYVFYRQYDSGALAMSALLAFVIFYIVVLYCIKQWQGRILNKALRDYVESVPSDVANSIEPYTRGLLVFGNLRLFSRIAVNGDGIYLYKQGCYSIRVPWSSVLTCKKNLQFDAVTLTLKKDGGDSLFLPWITAFDSYLENNRDRFI